MSMKVKEKLKALHVFRETDIRLLAVIFIFFKANIFVECLHGLAFYDSLSGVVAKCLRFS